MAPIVAQASDLVNLDEINSYSRIKTKSSRLNSNTFINELSEDLAILKGRVYDLKGKQSEFEAGTFSSTTTMDGSAVFSLGSVDYSNASNSYSEAVQSMYSYLVNLNSSFTGSDNLFIKIKTGNHSDWSVRKAFGSALNSANSKNDLLSIDKIWYQFPVGDYNTFWVGPKIENIDMHGTPASIYDAITKQFTYGGYGEAYGASTDTGAGWAYQADNGFTISSNFVTKSTQGNGTRGLLTNESKTSWATQVGYTKPRYSASAIVNIKSNNWSDEFFHTSNHGINGNGNYTALGLRGWWRPESTSTAAPSISVGFDTTEYDGAPSNTSNSKAYFVGFNWQDIFQTEDKIGIALGKPTTNESETTDPFSYEVYYSFNPNDSLTVTPAIFGASNRTGTSGDDIFGVVLETTFEF